MGLNGGLFHRWVYNYGGTAGRPLHSSYECVSLCHMDALYDTLTELEWIHRKQPVEKELSAELLRYAAANFHCKLHRAHLFTKLLCAEIWDQRRTMFYFTRGLMVIKGEC
jgi:hypothetical protein